ncbi:MAG: heliorhodopsin HeR [Dehalococcoidia bacterium]|nr:heliorhodopsin HeR [Thermoflexaceae bacterium]
MNRNATHTGPQPSATASIGGLRRFNIIMGSLHAVSATLMLVLSNDFSLPVTAAFADGPPGQSNPTLETLFSIPLGPLMATFLVLSALGHFVVASPWGYPRYSGWLRRGINPARWIEYSLSASIMIVAIALLPGITDFNALIGLFAVNAAMIFFGWQMELENEGATRVRWSSFIFGSTLGIIPWVAIGLQIAGAGSDVPTFVYGIFVTLFVLFNTFALNMLLQYAKVGPWRDYLFGERVYMWLSLIAKSLLAWQVFANTLAG